MTRDHAGVLAAIASSAIGGVAGGATRFVIHATDPVTLGVFRFGTGFLILLPIALITEEPLAAKARLGRSGAARHPFFLRVLCAL